MTYDFGKSPQSGIVAFNWKPAEALPLSHVDALDGLLDSNQELLRLTREAEYFLAKFERHLREKGRDAVEVKVRAVASVIGKTPFTLVVGPSGGGKSSIADGAVEGWRATAAQHLVFATAACDEVANQLGHRVKADGVATVARLVSCLERGEKPLGPNDLLVLDEASLVDLHQFAILTRAFQELGFRWLAMGDERQMLPQGPGDPLGYLVERLKGTPALHRMAQGGRQKDPVDALVAKVLRLGRADKAIRLFIQRGLIRQTHGRDAVMQHMGEAYVEAERSRPDIKWSHIALVPHIADKAEADEIIRQYLRKGGLLGHDTEVLAATGPLKIAVGEHIVLNFSPALSKNGTCWTEGRLTLRGHVLEIGEDSLSIRHKGGVDKITLKQIGQSCGLSYGYALDVMNAQGLSVDQSLVMAGGDDGRMSYVALTRHKDRCRIVMDTERYPDPETLGKACLRIEKRWTS